MHIQKATLCMKSIKQTKIYKEKKETKKKINYKRGGNKGTKERITNLQVLRKSL